MCQPRVEKSKRSELEDHQCEKNKYAKLTNQIGPAQEGIKGADWTWILD